MGNPREDAIRRSHTPAPSIGPPGSGPGSQGNVNTNPANDWIGSAQDSSVYYGNLPQSQGNTNVNVSNPAGGNYQGPVVNTGGGGSGLPGGGTDTGSGSSGGSGSGAAGSGMSGTELAALANAITGSNILGGAEDNLRKTSRNTFSLIDPTFQEGWENLEAKPVDTTINTDLLQPTIRLEEPTIEDKFNDWKSIDIGGGTASVEGSLTNPRLQYERNMLGGTGKFDIDSKGNLGALMSWPSPFAQGGPVGLMSLPQGYAAGGGVDPSDWRVIQQIIAAGGNPEDYGYENGGEVVEESETMEESTPFGGTRERVLDQVEAFDNAPHHIEEPMIGMYGEKVPLSIARRVQKYMEGLDPVKRGLIQETLDMFQNKKMKEKIQKMEEESRGGYFGPQPNEYNI